MLSIKNLVFKDRLVKVDRKICGIIQDRKSSIKKCSEVKTAGLYENSSSDKC